MNEVIAITFIIVVGVAVAIINDIDKVLEFVK